METAKGYSENALKHSRKAGSHWMIGLVLNSLIVLSVSELDFLKAQSLNDEALKITRLINDNWLLSGALHEAGNIAQANGDYASANKYFIESGEHTKQQGLQNDFARTRFNLGVIAILQRNLAI